MKAQYGFTLNEMISLFVIIGIVTIIFIPTLIDGIHAREIHNALMHFVKN